MSVNSRVTDDYTGTQRLAQSDNDYNEVLARILGEIDEFFATINSPAQGPVHHSTITYTEPEGAGSDFEALLDPVLPASPPAAPPIPQLPLPIHQAPPPVLQPPPPRDGNLFRPPARPRAPAGWVRPAHGREGRWYHGCRLCPLLEWPSGTARPMWQVVHNHIHLVHGGDIRVQ